MTPRKLLHPGRGDISDARWLDFLKIFAQSLTNVRKAIPNVLKHAQTTILGVVVELEHDFMEIAIIDNGIGISLWSFGKGQGIKNIGTRLFEAGEKLIFPRKIPEQPRSCPSPSLFSDQRMKMILLVGTFEETLLWLVEVTECLKVSDRTIASHVKSIYQKLRISSRAEACWHATCLGL